MPIIATITISEETTALLDLTTGNVVSEIAPGQTYNPQHFVQLDAEQTTRLRKASRNRRLAWGRRRTTVSSEQGPSSSEPGPSEIRLGM